jgi:dephospho-CoA kinase
MARKFLLVGLTGGIASGKSTVSRHFRDRGCLIIDADLLAREVLESAMTLTVPLLDEAERSLGSGLVFRRGLDPAKEC